MDNTDLSIRLYSAQTAVVQNRLMEDGVCFSKRRYVIQKYEESAPVFTAAYDWFVQEAAKIVPKPEKAEYPYWAYADLYNADASKEELLRLQVPLDEVLLFDMYDWYKLLRLQYIGEDEREEAAFQSILKDRGIRNESDVILTHFYPDLKRQVQSSWKNLFRYHHALKIGSPPKSIEVMAGLWQIKREWIVDPEEPQL